jgi:hypothetical protein
MHYIFARILSLEAALTLIGLLLYYQAIHSIASLSNFACEDHWVILPSKVNHRTECESSSLYQLVAAGCLSSGSRWEVAGRASVIIFKGLNAILLSEVGSNHLTKLLLIIIMLLIIQTLYKYLQRLFKTVL